MYLHLQHSAQSEIHGQSVSLSKRCEIERHDAYKFFHRLQDKYIVVEIFHVASFFTADHCDASVTLRNVQYARIGGNESGKLLRVHSNLRLFVKVQISIKVFHSDKDDFKIAGNHFRFGKLSSKSL